MTKTNTQWAMNTSKAPTYVTPVVRTTSQWTSNNAKNVTQFVTTPKQVDAWGHTSALQTYLYNDRFTYNDPLLTYNNLLNGNTYDELGQTNWSLN